MPTFLEWSEKYGEESAKAQFRLTDHLVITVYPGKNVVGRCGGYVVSEPLGNPERNPDVETALDRVREAIAYCFKTQEVIYDGQEVPKEEPKREVKVTTNSLQPLIVKRLAPTDYKGTRVKVTAAKMSRTYSWNVLEDHGKPGTWEKPYEMAVKKFVEEMEWGSDSWVGAWVERLGAFVFVSER